MQSYKSVKNVEIERKFARKADKQRGEISFCLDANTSGKIITPFVKPYADIPLILITLVIDGDHTFEVAAVVNTITTKDFTISVQNTSEEEVKGYLLWCTD